MAPFWPVMRTDARFRVPQRLSVFCRRPFEPPFRLRTKRLTGASGRPSKVVRRRPETLSIRPTSSMSNWPPRSTARSGSLFDDERRKTLPLSGSSSSGLIASAEPRAEPGGAGLLREAKPGADRVDMRVVEQLSFRQGDRDPLRVGFPGLRRRTARIAGWPAPLTPPLSLRLSFGPIVEARAVGDLEGLMRRSDSTLVARHPRLDREWFAAGRVQCEVGAVELTWNERVRSGMPPTTRGSGSVSAVT